MNGGYTVEEWNWWWKLLWEQGIATNITALFIAPAEGQEFNRGETFWAIIEYTGTVSRQGSSWSDTWTEWGTVDSYYLPAGNTFLRAAYRTNTIVRLKIKGRSLGTTYNSFDDIIIKKGNQYGIPPDLLKSLIHQEALKKHDEQRGQYLFEVRSYRYEAHIDYKWYSRQSSSVPPTDGWRGLGRHPEHHFVIGGYVVTGETVQQGDQVPSGYCYWSVTTAAGPLKFPNDKCEGVKAAQLIDIDLNSRQRWPSRPNWNFTAQLVLASSYGLCQTLYETAVNRGFDTRTESGKPARPVEQLFDPEVSIDLGAKYLASKYSGDWRLALFNYNGAYESSEPAEYDSWDYADDIMKLWNNGNGIYKEINY